MAQLIWTLAAMASMHETLRVAQIAVATPVLSNADIVMTTILEHAQDNLDLKQYFRQTFPHSTSAKKEARPSRFSFNLLYKTDLAKSVFRFDCCSTPRYVPRIFLDPATTRILHDECCCGTRDSTTWRLRLDLPVQPSSLYFLHCSGDQAVILKCAQSKSQQQAMRMTVVRYRKCKLLKQYLCLSQLLSCHANVISPCRAKTQICCLTNPNS